ncbi:unnamed protein product [Anisakis simplex]|uniref:Kelch-like protein 8 (inferred by orthology to a C. elegans protein) n=1 Tax=Anisakis simplex TaxID=6269 RepID=A0A0M3JXN7_ANISI|nr:unnamed protein product [Anisakis simplex]
MDDSMNFVPSGSGTLHTSNSSRSLPSAIASASAVSATLATAAATVTPTPQLSSLSQSSSAIDLRLKLSAHSDSVGAPSGTASTTAIRFYDIQHQSASASGSVCIGGQQGNRDCYSQSGQCTDYLDGQHSQQVLNSLNRFRLHNFMCDIEIEVEGNIFAAHRCVLAAAIPYFNSMFMSDMREARQKRVVIQDIPANAFRQLLEFAYTSHVSISGDNVQQLLYTASILQMDTVCAACQSFLIQNLTILNCLSIRQFAEQYNCVALLSSVDDFAMEHFAELRKLPEFLMIPIEHLLDMLRSSDLKVNNEQEVFELAMEWVGKAEQERKKHLPEILANIRLPLLPITYFLNEVIKHPLVVENVRCRDLVGEAMSEIMRTRLTSNIPATTPPLYPSESSYTTSCSSTQSLNTISTTLNSTAPRSFTLSTSGLLPEQGEEMQQANSSIKKISKVSAQQTNLWSNCRPRKSAAGVIFCVGGRGTSGDPFRSVEAFDWRRNRWLPVSDMNVRRRHVGVVSAQGKLYAIGGHDGTNHLDSAECFDPETNMWHTVESMDTHRRGIAVGALEGAIYAVGGLDDTACFQTVERYDIESDKWSSIAPMNVQRGGVGVAALGKYLFAVGGNDGTCSLDSCERYDPLLNKWKMVANMQHRRAGAGITVLDGCLYAIGGFDDNAPLPSCERYNPEDNSWTLLAQMSCPRGGVGVAAMGGRVYAIGGHDGVRYLNSVEAYEPLTNQWTPVASISQCRAGAGVAWADCRVDCLLRPPSMAISKDSGCAPCLTGVAHCV